MTCSGRIAAGRHPTKGRSGILNKAALLMIVVGALMVCAGAAIFVGELWSWLTDHTWQPLTAAMLLERYTDIVFWDLPDQPSERFLYWLSNLPLERLLVPVGLALSMLGTSRLR